MKRAHRIRPTTWGMAWLLSLSPSFLGGGWVSGQEPATKPANEPVAPDKRFESRPADPKAGSSEALPANSIATAPWSGALLLCGGAALPSEIRDCFFDLGGGERGKLVIIPTASPRSDGGDFALWLDYWKDFAWSSVRIAHAEPNGDLQQSEVLEAIRGATAVWIAGGDQSRLSERFGKTPVIDELRSFLGRGGVVGGTSAGAAIWSETMISGGRTEPRFNTGFGLLPGVMIDQHFLAKGRTERLCRAVHHHPGLAGLGIDESTGILIRGSTAEVMGAGKIHFYAPVAADLESGPSIETGTEAFIPDRSWAAGEKIEISRLLLFQPSSPSP